MKHRIFEYLVERKGFSVFAFETNWPDVESVNRYVRTGEGTAASAIKGHLRGLADPRGARSHRMDAGL